MSKILVCGDREWTDYDLIKKMLSTLSTDTIIVHGGQRGADSMGGAAAQILGLFVVEYKAEWSRYGKAAGPIRNKRMLIETFPSEVWAFHDAITSSKGTANMIAQASHAYWNPIVRLFRHGTTYPSNWFGVDVGCWQSRSTRLKQ